MKLNSYHKKNKIKNTSYHPIPTVYDVCELNLELKSLQ